MAKRKRLTPARVSEDTAAPETKTAFPRYPNGVYKDPVRPPIADVAHDAAASAALDEVTQTLTDARTEGRLIQRIALDLVDADYLVRDRLAVDADEMTTLVESLRARGQQTAIEVTPLDAGRYGLISGWRRLNALREISADTAGADTVLAIVRTPADAADAYLAMVEENEIRVGLSYYERARIVARAVDRGVYARDRVALSALFHAASRPKRSKIGAFVRIVRALDDHLTFPTALTERSGLALAQALEADASTAARVIAALTPAPLTAQAEAAAIARALQGDARTKGGVGPDAARDASQAAPAGAPAGADTLAGQTAPSPDILTNGLQIMSGADGSLTLMGTRMQDATFRTRLLAWLQAN